MDILFFSMFTIQKKKFSVKDFYSKWWPNPQEYFYAGVIPFTQLRPFAKS